MCSAVMNTLIERLSAKKTNIFTTKMRAKWGVRAQLSRLYEFLSLLEFIRIDSHESERGDIHIKLTHSKELFNIQVLRLLQVVCFLSRVSFKT